MSLRLSRRNSCQHWQKFAIIHFHKASIVIDSTPAKLLQTVQADSSDVGKQLIVEDYFCISPNTQQSLPGH